MVDELVTSGVASLDDLLGGGFATGDNVVVLADRIDRAHQLCDAFAAAHVGQCVRFSFASPAATVGSEVRTVALSTGHVATDPDAVIDHVLDEAGRHPFVVVEGFDDLFARCGARVAADFYRQTCPRLFELGTVALWPSDREVLAPAVATQVAQIAQCVLELRGATLRVRKAEGRPSRLQGALADLGTDDAGELVVGRELVAGRLGEGLRRLRQARNLTQKQLAEIAGVTPGAISQAESGRRGLSLETLVPLCDQLGIGLDELLGTRQARPHLLARRDRRPLDDLTTALFDDPELGTRAYRTRLAPRQVSAPPFAHKGVEMVLVASGLVMVDLGDDTPVMRAGDALMVTTEPIRSWANLGSGPAELFWVVSSPGRTEPGDANGSSDPR